MGIGNQESGTGIGGASASKQSVGTQSFASSGLAESWLFDARASPFALEYSPFRGTGIPAESEINFAKQEAEPRRNQSSGIRKRNPIGDQVWASRTWNQESGIRFSIVSES